MTNVALVNLIESEVAIVAAAYDLPLRSDHTRSYEDASDGWIELHLECGDEVHRATGYLRQPVAFGAVIFLPISGGSGPGDGQGRAIGEAIADRFRHKTIPAVSGESGQISTERVSINTAGKDIERPQYYRVRTQVTVHHHNPSS